MARLKKVKIVWRCTQQSIHMRKVARTSELLNSSPNQNFKSSRKPHRCPNNLHSLLFNKLWNNLHSLRSICLSLYHLNNHHSMTRIRSPSMNSRNTWKISSSRNMKPTIYWYRKASRHRETRQLLEQLGKTVNWWSQLMISCWFMIRKKRLETWKSLTKKWIWTK